VVAAFAGATVVTEARRVKALTASSNAEPLDPGHGRLMKEWVVLPATTSAICIELAREAHRFVASAK
jgi:hypothetical protein